MDKIDAKLIQLLSEDSRATATDLSEKVNLSIPAVSERIRNLEKSGLVEQFTVRVNREMVGYKLMAFIFVNINQVEYIDDARAAITALEEVIECHHMAGQYDYLLKVLLEDTKELETFVSDKLKRIQGVSATNTMISLSSIKDVINRLE